MAAISFSGLASGIDSASLIKSLLDQERRVKITPLENKNTERTAQNDSFSKIKELLATLSSKADVFRTINGSGLSVGTASTDETVLTGAASQSAVQGSYLVSVSSLAKNGTVTLSSSSATYTSADALISGGSSFSDTLGVTVGEGASESTVSVTVKETTTLQNFVDSFNTNKGNAAATASLVNVGTEGAANYKIVISSTNTGTSKGTLKLDVGATLSARSALNTSVESAATNAIFSIAGIGNNIQRSTNSVSDVLQGVTLSLKSSGSATLAVNVNASASTTAAKGFVTAYNDLIKYIADNDTITRDQSDAKGTNIFGTLAATSLDETLISSLRGALTGKSSSGGIVNVLADLGVATNRDGSLAFDENAFRTAITNDANGASRVLNRLGDTLGGTTGIISQYTAFGKIIDGAANSNLSAISQSNDRISQYEKQLSNKEQVLTSRYANLERLIGNLNGIQSSLSKILP